MSLDWDPTRTDDVFELNSLNPDGEVFIEMFRKKIHPDLRYAFLGILFEEAQHMLGRNPQGRLLPSRRPDGSPLPPSAPDKAFSRHRVSAHVLWFRYQPRIRQHV